MKHIKLFEEFIIESASSYGNSYSESGFNLMQKDLEMGYKEYLKDF